MSGQRRAVVALGLGLLVGCGNSSSRTASSEAGGSGAATTTATTTSSDSASGDGGTSSGTGGAPGTPGPVRAPREQYALGAVAFSAAGCLLDGEACPADLVQVGATGDSGVFTVLRPIWAESISVGAKVTLLAPAWSIEEPDGGSVELHAWSKTTVAQGAAIQLVGVGYGGGGGGAGERYNDGNFCPGDAPVAGGAPGGAVDGEPGLAPAGIGDCERTGGRAGGWGGTTGDESMKGRPGAGGVGAGPQGGAGGVPAAANGACTGVVGVCANAQFTGGAGLPGGYLAPGANGDEEAGATLEVFLGGGGGGGAGGRASTGYCCGGGAGGTGGIAGGPSVCDCNSGGGGSGGAAGGGRVVLEGNEVVVNGQLDTSGAGDAAAAGGYGAGGGILLLGWTRVTLGEGATLRSLGGNGFEKGVPENGGTLKVRSPDIETEGASIVSVGRRSDGPIH